MAAQAGVRYSMKNPEAYLHSNVIGFFNILESCRHHNIEHLVFASSSSVYGASENVPYSEEENVNHPISFYAATKTSNELMAYTYSHLYNIPTTGLRFFTVYGPWGRPDMAYYLFTERIMKGEPIHLFNNGNLSRDFTYVDDIVKAIDALVEMPPASSPDRIGTTLDISESFAPYRLCNIGNHKPVKLMEFVGILEELIGKKAIIENKPMQPGDMYETYADISHLTETVGFSPVVDIRTGLKHFVDWYKEYYK